MEKAKKVRIVAVGLFALTVISLFVISTPVLAAGNHTDHRYAVRYSGDGSDIATYVRGKWDATSSYCYNDQSQYSLFTSVWGSRLGEGAYGVVQSFDLSKARNCSWNGSGYQVAVGQSKYLPNSVRENGFPSCNLAFNPGSHTQHTVSVLWSPDSV